MSYIKQTWVDGDIVTAEKMNHIEDGVGNGGVFFVEFSTTPNTDDLKSDKTYSEIAQAIDKNQFVVAYSKSLNGSYIDFTYYPLEEIHNSENEYVFSQFELSGGTNSYITKRTITINYNNVIRKKTTTVSIPSQTN